MTFLWKTSVEFNFNSELKKWLKVSVVLDYFGKNQDNEPDLADILFELNFI